MYGQFLELFKDDVEISYYKDPPFIKNVNYSGILKLLFNTHISDNQIEDIHLKKTYCECQLRLIRERHKQSPKIIYIQLIR